MTRRKRRQIIILSLGLIQVGVGCLLGLISSIKYSESLYYYSNLLYFLSFFNFSFLLFDTLAGNNINKGFDIFLETVRIREELEKQLSEAGIFIDKKYYKEIPKIIINYENEKFSIKMENSIKNNIKLDNIEIAPALNKYTVKNKYLSEDENFYIFELKDTTISDRYVFSSFKDLYYISFEKGPYTISIDKSTDISLKSSLITGVTGSGKSYFMYNLILQLLTKELKHVLYFADPKSSSIYRLGKEINPDQTARDFDDILLLIQSFHEKMESRKKIIDEKSRYKIDIDYRCLSYPAHVLIIDEFAAFIAQLETLDSKSRKKVMFYLRSIVLQGREIGFFLVIAMQKSDSHLIETAIRDNLGFKLLLGNSEQQTFVTTFGTGIERKDKFYSPGEGLFTDTMLAQEPTEITIPTLNFDIMSELMSWGLVTTPKEEIDEGDTDD